MFQIENMVKPHPREIFQSHIRYNFTQIRPRKKIEIFFFNILDFLRPIFKIADESEFDG